MNIASFLVDAVIALWLLAVIVAGVRVWRARSRRLVPLSSQARERFVLSWERIASRFVHAPREAAHEADALVLSLLLERGHPVQGGRLPGRVQEARQWLAREGKDGTEALRQAMLQYKEVFNRMIGGRPSEKEQAAENDREMA
ncbi:MAG: hypothetical protein E6J20_19870 [Chloroflexi bacterium]|nr:MAG: hypothetical protein E6J20_19870 [Chloroflexota bacterium]